MILIYLILSILFSVFAGITEAFQIAERYGDYPMDEITEKRFGYWWHITQLMERISVLALGYFLFIVAGYDLINIIILILLTASIFWTVYDGLINTLRNQPRWWFYQSMQTTSALESFSGQVIKLIFFTIMLSVFIVRILLGLF